MPESLTILQRLSNYSRGSDVISSCLFQIDENSDSSLFYSNERHSNKVEINDCSFTGKLSNGAHHIDGKSRLIERPIIFVNSCKFSKDQRGALNSKFTQIDLNGQVLFTNKFAKNQMFSS